MKFSIFHKRVIYVCVFVLISIMVYGIMYINNLNKLSMQVNALPITNKVVVIDAGHGLPDEGAVGFNGTTEQATNLKIALKLQQLIEQSGAKVLLTRSDENGIYSIDSNSIRNKKVSDIKNRVEIGNNYNADIFISIHLNKFPESIYRGWQTFYQQNSEKSKVLSKCIQENLSKNIEFKNDRVPLPISGVYIMDKVTVPTIVVECGFLSNPQEAEMLKGENYQNKIAWGIFIGIQEYFEKEGVSIGQ
ncbi:MAG: N-acetylmuramoyl-L-alanine amidase [Clostridia bacterium]|nr:N-acetylmuramoyl-L-alanine amidase [Clostridia bacterium]